MTTSGESPMKILALEFSSPQRSVAVVSGGSSAVPTVSEIVEASPGHTMKPLGMVEEALQQAGLEREQIECLTLGLGPGSYTGIRLTIALAQGWQLATGVKLLGLSSADCVAAQAQAEGITGRCCVVIDAQREEYYAASFELSAEARRATTPLRLATLAEMRSREQAGELLIGPEVTRWFPQGRVIFPRAAVLGRLALEQKEFVTGDKLEPIYLRETRFVKAPPPRRERIM